MTKTNLKRAAIGKKILVIIAVAIVVIIIGLTILLTQFDSIARVGIEKAMTWALKVPVTVDSVHVSIFSGEASIKGLIITNPEGYNTPNAFSINEASAKLDLKSFSTDEPVIHEILIKAPIITLEQGLTESNLSKLVDNTKSVTSEAPAESKADESKEEAPESDKNIKIERILLEGAKVEVSSPALHGKVVPVPIMKIELTDIGGKKDKPVAAEALNKILVAVIDGVAKSGEALPKETLEALNSSAATLKKGISEGLEKNKKAIGSFLDSLKSDKK